MRKLLSKFFHTCRRHWLLPFYTTFSDWLWLRVTRSVQSKTCWLHFFTHFSVEWDEVWYDDEAMHAEHPDTHFTEIYGNKGNNCCSTDLCTYKKINTDMHSGIWEPISFKLCMMILLNSTFWYLSVWPRAWFKVMGMQERKNFCANCSPQFWMDLNGIEYAAETCLSDQSSYTHFINLILISSPPSSWAFPALFLGFAIYRGDFSAYVTNF